MVSAMSSLADWSFNRDNPSSWQPKNHEQRRSKNEENRMIPSSATRLTVTFNDTVIVATIINDNYQSAPTTNDQLCDTHTAQLMTRRSPAPKIIDPQKRTSDPRLDTLLESQNEWMRRERDREEREEKERTEKKRKERIKEERREEKERTKRIEQKRKDFELLEDKIVQRVSTMLASMLGKQHYPQ